MKNFLAIFAMSLVLCYFFFFFGGILVFENFLAMLISISLIIAILFTAFTHQEIKIEELETRIKTLESKNEHKE